MHRGGVATRLEIEMRVLGRRSVEQEGFDEAFAIGVGLRGEFKLRVTGLRDLEFAKRGRAIAHNGFVARFADLEDESAAFIAFQSKARDELAGRFELAEPRDALFRALPAAEAFFLRELDATKIRVAVGGEGRNAQFGIGERDEAKEGEEAGFH